MTRAARLTVAERRARLLDLGLQLFSKRSYEDVSTDDIALAAGVSKGLLYHYFSGKRGYYIATIRELARRVIAVTEMPTSLSLREAVSTALRRYVAFVRDNADFYAALLRGGAGADDEAQPILAQARQAVIRRLFAQAGIGEPSARMRTAVAGWIGYVEACALDWIAHGCDHDEDELVELMVAGFVVLVGVGAGTAYAPPR